MKSEKTGGVYVGFFSYQTGKCRKRSACMHQAARVEKMLAFLREGVDFVDTLNAWVLYPGVFFAYIGQSRMKCVLLFCE